MAQIKAALFFLFVTHANRNVYKKRKKNKKKTSVEIQMYNAINP